MPRDLEDQLDAALDKAFPPPKRARMSRSVEAIARMQAAHNIIAHQSTAIERLKSERSALTLALSLAVLELDQYGYPKRSVQDAIHFDLMKSLIETAGL